VASKSYQLSSRAEDSARSLLLTPVSPLGGIRLK
jgi:hypothetical protein